MHADEGFSSPTLSVLAHFVRSPTRAQMRAEGKLLYFDFSFYSRSKQAKKFCGGSVSFL